MKQEAQYLLEIVKYILNNKIGELAIPAENMDWELVIKLAQNHSISNLVHYGVECLPLEYKPNEETCKHLYQNSINAIVRSFNQIEGKKELFQAFEKERIYALAVKGICTKQHYPQPDMRTMGDVDILYQPQQNDKVKQTMQDLGYEHSMEGRKHDIYSRRPYMAIEMHRELVSSDSTYSSYYETIWNRVQPKENCKYIHEMSREDEYIFTLVHLAGHFKDGGIGIRFIMDVYVYNHLEGMDWDYIETELRKLKLWEFYGNISQLAEEWFGIAEKCNEENNELINSLSTFIITNGTFGSTRNAAAAATAGEGRFQSLLNAVFPSLKSMQSMFEWLKKWPILLPYAWILRGIRSVLSRRRRMNIKYHVDKYRSSDKEYGEQLQKFFETCGLKNTKEDSEEYKNGLEVDFLLKIIKYILHGEKGVVPLPQKELNWKQLFQIAKSHNLLNLLYYGVECLPTDLRPDEAEFERLKENAMYELVVSYNQTETAKELLGKFEEAGIYAVTVKGVCTKQHYPQPDMRSMSDIDILYKEHQQKKLREVMKFLEYDEPVEGRVHDSYIKAPYINVEAHRKLVAADSEYNSYYEDIWERLRTKDNCKYAHEMSLEDEYIFTIVHLAEHFQNGGIGIRFVMDIYVYNCIDNMNWEYVEKELKKIKLWEFYQNISQLAKMWFGEKEIYSDDDKKRLNNIEQYILSSGTFGTQKNSAAISVAKKGRVKFLWKAVFPDLKNMQSMFPWLKKWPILLPYAWVLRGVRSIIFRRRNIKAQLEKYRYGDKKYGEKLKNFFKMCGL